MSSIIQLYTNKEKTIKGYPKTLTTSVFNEDGETTIKDTLEEINNNINTIDKHSHTNHATLEAITSDKITKWDAAETNVQADWSINNIYSDAYIKNKPPIINDLIVGGDTKVLSAEQGKVLYENMDKKSFKVITNNEFNSLVTRDPNTIYIIGDDTIESELINDIITSPLTTWSSNKMDIELVNINNAKIDDLNLEGSILKLIANGNVKKSITLPSGGGSSSEVDHAHDNMSALDMVSNIKVSNWDASYIHSISSHAPSMAQKNSDITKEEIEAKLTGEITSHTHPESGQSENKSVIPLIKNELEADENEIFIIPRETAEFTTVLNNVNVAEDGTMTIANESVAKSAAFTITKDGIFVIETTSTNTGFYYIATKINGISINGSWTKEARRYDYVVKGGDTVTINFDNGSRGYTIKAYGEAKNDIIWKANNEFTNLSIGEQNVQSDWNSTDMFSDSYIKNKPYITDNLTSTSATNVLSARQGKILDDKINQNTSSLADITQNQPSDLSLNGTTLKLKKADGTTIGTGITLPQGGEGHTHTNKTVLDGITQEKVTQWDSNSGGSSTDNTFNSTSKSINYIPTNSKFGTVGRWFKKIVNDNEYIATINMGSELLFKVYNTTKVDISFVKLTTVTHLLPAITYKVNEGEWTRTVISDTTPISITGLNVTKEYLIRLKVDDIQEGNSLWNDQAGVIIKDVTLDIGGVQYGVVPNNKMGLFIGDSITAGISMRGGSQPDSGGASVSYPSICCENLGVQDFRWAFGMTGIVAVGPNGIPNALGYIYKMCANIYDYNLEKPNFIVINLGTNDSLQSKDVTQFKNGYTELVNALKRKFPRVPIIAIIPFGQYYAEHIRTVCTGISDVFICETSSWGITFDYGVHPGVASHKIAGDKLSQFLINTLGEKYFKGENISVEYYKNIIDKQATIIGENQKAISNMNITLLEVVQRLNDLDNTKPPIEPPESDIIFTSKISGRETYEKVTNATTDYSIFRCGIWDGFKPTIVTASSGWEIVDYTTLIDTTTQKQCIAINFESNCNVIYMKVPNTIASEVSVYQSYILSNNITLTLERNTTKTEKFTLDGTQTLTQVNLSTYRLLFQTKATSDTTKYKVSSTSFYELCNGYCSKLTMSNPNSMGVPGMLRIVSYQGVELQVSIPIEWLGGNNTIDGVTTYLTTNPIDIWLTLK